MTRKDYRREIRDLAQQVFEDLASESLRVDLREVERRLTQYLSAYERMTRKHKELILTYTDNIGYAADVVSDEVNFDVLGTLALHAKVRDIYDEVVFLLKSRT